MNCPLVSIVISTHKGSDSVAKAVDSILVQGYSRLEIIVVDDNGLNTDEQQKTKRALAGYIAKNKLTYIAHEQNKNGSAARNTGWKASSGKYIGFLDDDDLYLDGKIEKSVAFLEKHLQYGAVFTNTIVVKKERKYRLRTYSHGNVVFGVLTHSFFMNPGTLLIRKDIVDKLNGFDESFTRHQDIEFNTRLAATCKIGHIHSFGSVYNSLIKRHLDPSKRFEYRSYYIKKMLPIIHALSKRKQEIVLIKNAMDLVGSKKSDIEKVIKDWDGMEFRNFSYWLAILCDFNQKLMYKLGAIL